MKKLFLLLCSVALVGMVSCGSGSTGSAADSTADSTICKDSTVCCADSTSACDSTAKCDSTQAAACTQAAVCTQATPAQKK